MDRRIVLYLGYSADSYHLEKVKNAGVSEVVVSSEAVNSKRVNELRSFDFEIGISTGALPGGKACPASDEAIEHLKERLEEVSVYQPDTLWLDHLRFEGRWESARESMHGAHHTCSDCRGKDRGDVIFRLIQEVRKLINENIRLGYFAVPFYEHTPGKFIKELGQDHRKLCQVADVVSPMVYHRMLGKPESFISEYVQYLSDITDEIEILPIVQVKDMPDHLPDKLTVTEISRAVAEAVKPPSSGVSFFSFDHALESNKEDEILGIIQKELNRGKKANEKD